MRPRKLLYMAIDGVVRMMFCFSFYLFNMRMRSKQDIKKGQLCTWGGSPRNCRWGCDVWFFKLHENEKHMLFFVRLYALVVL